MFFDSLFLNITILLVLIIALVFDYVTKYFSYWYVRNIAYKAPIPFIGSDYHRVLGLRNSTQEVNKLCLQYKNEKLIGYIKSRIPDLIIKDSKVLKTILSTDFENFPNRGLCLDKSQNVCLKNNLFYTDGEKWTLLRNRLVTLMDSIHFKLGDINSCLSGINGETNVKHLTENILDNVFTQILIDDYSNLEERLVISNIRSIAQDRSLVSRFKSYTKNIFPSVFVLFDLWINRNDSTEKTCKILENSKLMKVIRTSQLQTTLCPKQKYTKKNENISETEFALSMLNTFVIEGILPCQHVLTALFYELSKNPKIQQTARASINTNKDIYLENVIKESIRLHPPFSIISRKCVKTYKFPDTGLLIDKGLTLTVPIEAIHLDNGFYKDPVTFNPNRFNESKEPLDAFAFLPFGAGKRKCPGEELSLQIIRDVTKAFLLKFNIETTEKTPSKLPVTDHNFGRIIDGDIWLKFTEIS